MKILLFLVIWPLSTLADGPTSGWLDQISIDWRCEYKGRLITSDNCILKKVGQKEKELKELYLKLKSGAQNREKSWTNFARDLDTAQESWFKMRKAQCRWIGNYWPRQGSTREAKCLYIMTSNRIKELKKIGLGLLWENN